MKKFITISILFFTVLVFSGIAYSQKYSPELQRKLDAFEKADKEIFFPWFKIISDIPDINTLTIVDREISKVWWERHIATGWEIVEDQIITERNELLERISLRFQWLCHNEAMKILKQ